MNNNVIKSFIRELINENATYKHIAGFSLDVRDLSISEQSIFLSNICDSDDFIWIVKSPVRLQAAIKENLEYMQELIDENINDIWHENMQEAGLSKGQYSDNGEIYYY